MYPPITQFETRDLRILDELRLRAERQLDREPQVRRSAVLRFRIARIFSGRSRRAQAAGMP